MKSPIALHFIILREDLIQQLPDDKWVKLFGLKSAIEVTEKSGYIHSRNMQWVGLK